MRPPKNSETGRKGSGQKRPVLDLGNDYAPKHGRLARGDTPERNNKRKQGVGLFQTPPKKKALVHPVRTDLWDLCPDIISHGFLRKYVANAVQNNEKTLEHRLDYRGKVSGFLIDPSKAPNLPQFIEDAGLTVNDLFSVINQFDDFSQRSPRGERLQFSVDRANRSLAKGIWRGQKLLTELQENIHPFRSYHGNFLFCWEMMRILGGGSLAFDKFDELIVSDYSIDSLPKLLRRLHLLTEAELCYTPSPDVNWRGELAFLRFAFAQSLNPAFNDLKYFLKNMTVDALVKDELRNYKNVMAQCHDSISISNTGNVSIKQTKKAQGYSYLFRRLSEDDTLSETSRKVLSAYSRLLRYTDFNALNSLTLYLLDSDPTERKTFITNLLERSLRPVFDELDVSPDDQSNVVSELVNRFTDTVESPQSTDKTWQSRVRSHNDPATNQENLYPLDNPFEKIDLSLQNLPKWKKVAGGDDALTFFRKHYGEWIDNDDASRCRIDFSDVLGFDKPLYTALKAVERRNDGQLADDLHLPTKGERLLALTVKVSEGELEMPQEQRLRRSIRDSARRNEIALR
ncbi:MAG: hypothetical protein ACSHXY_00535 [Alphaproteobacteria bacterium]